MGGYGSYMIQKIHQQIYNDDDEDNNKSSPIMLTFTATPHSIHLYGNNGYKRFIKVFIGVELAYYGFLYHEDTDYLNKILTVFPKNYQIDLSVWNHVLPNSISKWIVLGISMPFIICWILVFVL